MNKETSTSVVSNLSLREAFGQALVDLAEKYAFYVLDPDLASGTGCHKFRATYPDRYLNCGIAEQNMMGMAAGINLATDMPVFVTGFASFLMRAWEIARLSVAYNRDLDVKIVASHLGLDVGPDGHSAQSFEDIACWRAIDNMAVVAPCTPAEVRQATEEILKHNGPVYMRTGRSAIEGEVVLPSDFKLGESQIVHKTNNPEATIIAYGVTVYRSVQAARQLTKAGIPTDVINMSTIKPLDGYALQKQADLCDYFLVVEDHHRAGGLGEAVSSFLSGYYPKQVDILCMPSYQHGESGDPNELAMKFGLDSESIRQIVVEHFNG